jgi:DNA-binding CsgD family transcriptional regulator
VGGVGKGDSLIFVKAVQAGCVLGSRCLCGGMSPRKREVFHRLLTGDCEKEAARALGMSRNTLHCHARGIFRALNVSSRTELLALVIVRLRPVEDRGEQADSIRARARRPAKKHRVELSAEAHDKLRQRIGGAGADRIAVRAEALMLANEGETDVTIASKTRLSVRTIERLRARFVMEGIDSVDRRPQPPRPKRREQRGHAWSLAGRVNQSVIMDVAYPLNLHLSGLATLPDNRSILWGCGAPAATRLPHQP